ncbi:MAG: hypothetical protein EZS26_002316 [Candidatus Ordinivivax streblomastigis]|uniref:DUF4292 domain-containing protein n=1 Tax=Candidatus Ordinivivax streblomastigis TaxID=2540710 RepID=A0A5M8NZJ8_9BACT|nr:MAG: hypothetical protein EZS26_002316 [Candidatus Ordinivivax streblomastigis]
MTERIMNNITKFLCLSALVALLFSCKSTQQPAVAVNEITFQTLSANLKLTLQSNAKRSSVSVDGQLKVVKGEALQLSLLMPFLGTEVFRILITPDEMILLDRINGQYFCETMPKIQDQLPFTFDYLTAEALWTDPSFAEKHPELKNLQCEYTAWGLTSNQTPFPMNMNWIMNLKDGAYRMNSIFKSVDMNTNVSIQRTIPNKYTRISIRQALKLINSFV